MAAQTSEAYPRVEQLLGARDYAGAERLLQGELSRSPDWDAGHLLLAQIYSRTGRDALAEQSALRAVRLRESLDGFMVLAVSTMRLGRLNDSIAWLERAARRQPDHASIYRVLGLDYALGGEMREAESAFARAVALQPDDWESQYYRGRALFELGRFQASADCLRLAVALNAASGKSWTALGQAEERLGRPDAAEASYGKALTACQGGPECAWPLLQLGFLYRTGNDPERALAFFRKAAQARPDWARTHYHLGKELADAGQLAEARVELETAVKLEEARSEYHYQLSRVYRQLGEKDKAGAQLARFRALAGFESRTEPAPEFTQP